MGRGWWIAGAGAAIVISMAAAAVVFWVVPRQTPVETYRDWATQLRTYANDIGDPGLARHAQKLADLADETVRVVVESRDGAAQLPVPTPPAWVQKYAAVNSQFRTEIGELVAACPA